ncbi:hypothetical protein CVT26_007493 [Gymnopilus dilepis]|uniref:J domain-containing protein n=1 Tax=Gymnopilus dilepis TaxID=231916 RepID=A0A409YSM8_9AGAR|nr:hypothetical protein CVT26_007493 [Gymnopilus dilepis]
MGAAESNLKPSLDFENMDLYEVLGIALDASDDEIKRAFRQRALETHPDKNLEDKEEATKRFLKVQEAFETLSDPSSRAAYNWKRENPPSPSHERHADPMSDFMPGQWGPGTQGRTSSSSKLPRGWFGWFLSLISGVLAFLFSKFPKSWTEPSDPFLRFIPEEYIARNEHIMRPHGISAKDIYDYILSIDKKKPTWNENNQDQSLFTLLQNLFECLAYDEHRWGSTEWCPKLGRGTSAWCREDSPGVEHYAQDFYEYWLNFETKKPFDWIKPYYTDSPEDPWVMRQVAKKNREIQAQVREEYNQFIRNLAENMLAGDPRFLMHVYLHYHREGKAPSDAFYRRYIQRSRARASQPPPRSQPTASPRNAQPEEEEEKPKTKKQSRNQRKKQSQRHKANQKKSW